MAKPVLLTIDDERTVLGSVERDLMRRYRKDYRVLKALSGERTLSITRELKQKGIPVALFLVDQRMPAMTWLPLRTKRRSRSSLPFSVIEGFAFAVIGRIRGIPAGVS